MERQQYIVCVGKLLHFELRTLCSDEHVGILSGSNIDKLMSFKWINMIEEVKKHVPVLVMLLGRCTKTPTERQNTDGVIHCKNYCVISTHCSVVAPF